MNDKLHKQLCSAFCEGLSVHPVPAGLAVGTGYADLHGDPLSFFVVGPQSDGRYRVQDDGLVVPWIEAIGPDLSEGTRREAFDALLREYKAKLDESTHELVIDGVSEGEIGLAAVRFIALLLRVQDLLLLSAERVASTFREDATRAIRQAVGPDVLLDEGFVVSPSLAEVPADLGLIAPGRPPVALFFATHANRVLEALLLQAYAEKAGIDCRVVALLETDKAISTPLRNRAANHLAAVPVFRADQRAATQHIVRQLFGRGTLQ